MFVLRICLRRLPRRQQLTPWLPDLNSDWLLMPVCPAASFRMFLGSPGGGVKLPQASDEVGVHPPHARGHLPRSRRSAGRPLPSPEEPGRATSDHPPPPSAIRGDDEQQGGLQS